MQLTAQKKKKIGGCELSVRPSLGTARRHYGLEEALIIYSIKIVAKQPINRR